MTAMADRLAGQIQDRKCERIILAIPASQAVPTPTRIRMASPSDAKPASASILGTKASVNADNAISFSSHESLNFHQGKFAVFA